MQQLQPDKGQHDKQDDSREPAGTLCAPAVKDRSGGTTSVLQYHSFIASILSGLLAGTIGIWGVCFPLFLFLCLFGPWRESVMPMGNVALIGIGAIWLIGLIFSCLLADKRIVLSEKEIVFPLLIASPAKWADLAVAKLGKERTVPGCSEPFVDTLRLYFRGGRVVSLRIQSLSRADLKLLLAAICKRAPQSKQHRSLAALSRTLDKELPARRLPKDDTEIAYRPHGELSKFFKLITTYERHYWRVWLPTTGLALAVISPYFFFYAKHLICNLPYDIPDWMEPLNKVLNFIGDTAGKGGSFFYEAVTTPVAAAALFTVTALSALAVLRIVLQPNILSLTGEGPGLYKRLFGSKLKIKAIGWSDISRVRLSKPRRTTLPEQWSIILESRQRASLKLKLGAIMRQEDRQKLMRSIDEYAPAADRDPELLEAFMPAQKGSYTELWLQSLSAPPKRERLAPLPEGASMHDGRYKILHQIGVGGQGTAYLAERNIYDPLARKTTAAPASAETVVLKEFILPVYVDRNVRRQALERFEHEAAMLQRLDHCQVVKLMDFFVEDHRGYLVLEHIDGMSLRAMVDSGGPFSTAQVHELALQMCDILQYLHGLSPPVVHRDFTPDNLILNSAGLLKLIDFNVAQQRESTTTGTVVGKHAYLPPEQFRGKPTPQSDIYALGGTLFYLLTGKDPEPLTPCHPVLLRSDTDPRLDAIIASCTALESRNRMANILDLRLELTQPDNNSPEDGSG